ncbi:MAG: CpXC domain-containing protein [Candidatus Aminicenantales bacterium]
MSRKIDLSVACPVCGFQQIASAFTSINVTLHPDLRDALFKDVLNRATCPDCGNSYLIPVNLLYHDMEKKIAVWFCPQGDLPEKERKALEKVAEKMGIGRHLMDAPTTDTWEEFKQTIQALESAS